MRIVSFNTNGIRTREHQLLELKERYHPDLIGIQETKVADDAFPLEMIQGLGYHPEYFGQKTHYGVALLSHKPPTNIQKGFPGDQEDAQRRMIAATYPLADGRALKLINGYFPQGEKRDHPVKFPAKQRFYADLINWLEESHNPDDLIAVIGDMNIAPTDQDIGIGEQNAKRWLKDGKCSFLPEEREWLARLQQWGLHDSFRNQHPDTQEQYSWFDYRSKGFEREPRRGLRIDLILVTAPLLALCTQAGIADDIRSMTRPSDHCPIWAEFNLNLA
jgi:exodeoxyribonuclease-3